ncbi:MAG: radical SAM protein [Planctomycetes bacterium]|nr:radical SAM protein [Planctomycetota bacterium]
MARPFRVVIVVPPSFSRGLQPVSAVGYLNAVLRRQGYEVLDLDLDYLLTQEDPTLSQWVYRLQSPFNQPERVNFFVRPELVLWSLSGDADPPPEAWTPKEAPQVFRIQEWMRGAAGRILALEPDALLVTSHITSLWCGLLLAKNVKRDRPQLPIVVGGPGVGLPEVRDFVLDLGTIDYVVVGEGDVTAVELLDHLARHGGAGCGLAGVAERGTYTPRPMIRDLDSLPLPDFTGLPAPGLDLWNYRRGMRFDRITIRAGAIPVSSSRGCVFKCSFCSDTSYWHQYRSRSAEAVAEEIDVQTKKHGAPHVMLIDSLLNPKAERLDGLLSAMESRQDKPCVVFAQLTARALPPETVGRMARAGFRYVIFGVDGISQEMLDLMRKGTNADDVLSVVTSVSQAGMAWYSGFLVGHPGEMQQDILKGAAFLRELAGRLRSMGASGWNWPHLHIQPVRVEPYSALYQTPARFGVKLGGFDIRVPPSLSHLRSRIQPLLVRWENAPEPRDLARRMMLLKKLGAFPEAQEVPIPADLVRPLLRAGGRVVRLPEGRPTDPGEELRELQEGKACLWNGSATPPDISSAFGATLDAIG